MLLAPTAHISTTAATNTLSMHWYHSSVSSGISPRPSGLSIEVPAPVDFPAGGPLVSAIKHTPKFQTDPQTTISDEAPNLYGC